MSNKVFVYGSLRQKPDKATHVLMGYGLFDYGRFPFIAPVKDGVVYGEILTVSDEDLQRFDYIEGVASRFYKRVRVNVVPLHKDKETKAWVYVPDRMLAGDAREYPRVASGDWFNHPSKQQNVFVPFRFSIGESNE